MDRIVLIVNGQTVYDNGSQFTTPTPTPEPTPPQGVPAPGLNHPVPPDFALRVAGQNWGLPGGDTVWTVPDRSTNFGIEIGGGDGVITVAILNPDGSVADQPKVGMWAMGPARSVMWGGAGAVDCQVKTPGTYTVRVSVEKSNGAETIRLRDV